MRKSILFLAAALLLHCLSFAAAESGAPVLLQDGRSWIGYTCGGATFAAPDGSVSHAVSRQDRACGSFSRTIGQQEGAGLSARIDGDSEILICRSTQPSAQSGLYGIAMTGRDGLFCKTSVITDGSGAYGAGAPVRRIAETIGGSVCYQDFSEWGIGNAPDPSSPKRESPITSFLKQLLPG